MNVLSANSRQRFPLKNVESFNLEQPTIELYLDDDYFAFGGIAPVTNEQYLAINGEVYLVSPRYAIWMPASPMDLISLNLLDRNEIPVQFELQDALVKLEQGDKWTVDATHGLTLSSERLANWIEQWHEFQATEFELQPADNIKPLESVQVTLKDGGKIVFNVVIEAAGAVFYRSSEQAGYRVPKSVSDYLLDPFLSDRE